MELWAAFLGACVSGILMILANKSSRRQGDIREIFGRLNNIEQAIARLESAQPRQWRNR